MRGVRAVKVGLVVHAGRAPSLQAATEAARLLRGLGVEVLVTSGDGNEPVDVEGFEVVDPDGFVAAGDGPGDGTPLDLAMSFGGDGTFLRAAHLCRDAAVPVLGVNLGRLGFLAEVDLDDLGAALREVNDGAWSIEERRTIEVVVNDDHGTELGRGWALNEVAVEKTVRQRLLHMDVHIDGSLFARVPADALILATATGSTAYALSAGGPILSPRVDATLVVPVAPHSLFDRTLVAAPDEEIRVDLGADQAPALVSCDGRPPVTVPPGGSVTAVGNGRPVQLAKVGLADFPTLVRRKFGLR